MKYDAGSVDYAAQRRPRKRFERSLDLLTEGRGFNGFAGENAASGSVEAAPDFFHEESVREGSDRGGELREHFMYRR
jgi:hypothetical protein